MAYKILIVDDEKNLRNSLALFLTRKGYLTFVAENGVEALEMIDDIGLEDFDLIITDIMMPKMDGLKLVKEINNRNLYIDILVMSAYGDDSIQSFCEEGCYRFIEKPLNLELLIDLINSISSSDLIKRIRNMNIHPKTFVAGLMHSCTLGKAIENCPLHNARKLPIKERLDLMFEKTDEELKKIYDIHSKCIRKREILSIQINNKGE